MSHFTQIHTTFCSADCLVEALHALGFSPIVHSQPAHLYGYQGDRRPQTAHIVVDRSQIGSYANDLGFALSEGVYNVVISEYDQQNGAARSGHGLGPSFLNLLRVEYALASTLKTAHARGHTVSAVTRTSAGGYSIRLQPQPITAQTQTQRR